METHWRERQMRMREAQKAQEMRRRERDSLRDYEWSDLDSLSTCWVSGTALEDHLDCILLPSGCEPETNISSLMARTRRRLPSPCPGSPRERAAAGPPSLCAGPRRGRTCQSNGTRRRTQAGHHSEARLEAVPRRGLHRVSPLRETSRLVEHRARRDAAPPSSARHCRNQHRLIEPLKFLV
jgi:hypothetical protein